MYLLENSTGTLTNTETEPITKLHMARALVPMCTKSSSDIRSFSSLNFLSASFSFCPRLCNKLAHDVAACGVRLQETRSLWLESLPIVVNVPVTSTSAESVV
jgi:hypothetical protein